MPAETRARLVDELTPTERKMLTEKELRQLQATSTGEVTTTWAKEIWKHGLTHLSAKFKLKNGDIIEFWDAKSNMTGSAQLHMFYPST